MAPGSAFLCRHREHVKLDGTVDYALFEAGRLPALPGDSIWLFDGTVDYALFEAGRLPALPRDSTWLFDSTVDYALFEAGRLGAPGRLDLALALGVTTYLPTLQ